jgi:twitching motility protein PilT
MDMTELLALAIKQNASDLHLSPFTSPMIRCHGDLIPIDHVPPLSPDACQRLIYSIMNVAQQESFEAKLELDISLNVPDIGNFRVNVMQQSKGIAAVFRLIPESVPSLDELALPPILKTLCILPHGLIIVSGATGSGKSTTMAAMIDYINTFRACNIITIEDPIEFIFKNKKSIINQRQVGRDTANVASALRSSLRQDPDVIMIGEMRDVETVRLALTAAETGHLVLATLHASSAPLAISRIVDMFDVNDKSRIRNLLSESIQAVICQALVRGVNTGRVGAFEIMLANAAIRHLIREDKIAHMPMTIQTSGNIGMCTLEQYLQLLVARNLITTSMARTVISRTDWFLV